MFSLAYSCFTECIFMQRHLFIDRQIFIRHWKFFKKERFLTLTNLQFIDREINTKIISVYSSQIM